LDYISTCDYLIILILSYLPTQILLNIHVEAMVNY
jgi:hypothetical protein